MSTCTNALFGHRTSRRCHSLPYKKVTCRIGSCKCRVRTKLKKEKCVCVKALLKKKKLTGNDIFDELGNYNYCNPILTKMINHKKLANMRTLLNTKLAELMPDYRYATARTILKYNLENYIYGDLPGLSSTKCIRVVLKEIAHEDDYLIKLCLTERKNRARENEKFSIIPYSGCMTPFHLLKDIKIARRHYRLHQILDKEAETEDDPSDSESEDDVQNDFLDEFKATVNLKFWDNDVPYEMTMEDISIDTEKCECVIHFSREEYERFTAKRQRRH